MDSDSSISFKRVIFLLLGFITTFILVLFIGRYIVGYKVYINNKCVGNVKNKTYMKSVVTDLENDLGDRAKLLSIDSLVKYNIGIVDKNGFKNEDTLKENILNSLNNEVDALAMKIDEKEVAVVSNEDEGKLIIEKLKKEYISKYSLKEESIEEVNINNNISYEDKAIPLNELNTFDNTYKKFIENINVKGDKFISTSVKTIKEENKSIARTTIINSTDKLYKGQSNVVDEGEDGEKIVKKLLTLSNGSIKDEKIIGETITKQPKQKIVQNGTKNPIGSDVAFLAPPSRGINNITSNFGARWGRNHNGIDIAGGIGDPIFAALDGMVSFSGVQDGYGNVIIIKHGDGMETIYGHCSKLEKKVGDKVAKGDKIALVGNTGRSTGPHLHFELRVNGEPKDPLKLIAK